MSQLPPSLPWLKFSTRATPLPSNYQPPRPAASNLGLALTIVMWIAWAGAALVADFLGLMMFAFADSPGAGNAARRMIMPAFAWAAFALFAGAVLLYLRRWWSIALAFVLAVSLPFMIFAGYNLLDSSTKPSTPTQAPMVQVPPGGFKPAPMQTPPQPNFRKGFSSTQTTQP
jgi:hypothetical protein